MSRALYPTAWSVSVVVMTCVVAAWAQEQAMLPPAYTLDWTLIIVALIGGVPVALTSATGLLVVLLRQKEMHRAMNSRLDEMIAAVEEAALAKGKEEGAQTERAAEAMRQALSRRD